MIYVVLYEKNIIKKKQMEYLPHEYYINRISSILVDTIYDLHHEEEKILIYLIDFF